MVCQSFGGPKRNEAKIWSSESEKLFVDIHRLFPKIP